MNVKEEPENLLLELKKQRVSRSKIEKDLGYAPMFFCKVIVQLSY